MAVRTFVNPAIGAAPYLWPHLYALQMRRGPHAQQAQVVVCQLLLHLIIAAAGQAHCQAGRCAFCGAVRVCTSLYGESTEFVGVRLVMTCGMFRRGRVGK